MKNKYTCGTHTCVSPVTCADVCALCTVNSIYTYICEAKHFYSVYFVQAANFTRPSRLDREKKKNKRICAATYTK